MLYRPRDPQDSDLWRLIDHRRAVVAAAAGVAIVVAASAPLLVGLPGHDSGTGTAGDASADRIPGVSIPFVERVNELDERLFHEAEDRGLTIRDASEFNDHYNDFTSEIIETAETSILDQEQKRVLNETIVRSRERVERKHGQ